MSYGKDTYSPSHREARFAFMFRFLSTSSHGAVALLLFFAGGCRSSQPELATPEPAPTQLEHRVERPIIRPGIRINVVVEVARSIENRADNVRVNVEGNVPLPLVGEVHVAGLTLREAERVLAEAYSTYYRNPTVRVDFGAESNDATSPWGYVTVLGEVRNPGRVNLPPTLDLTLTRAIQLAGGLGRSARVRSVRITRWTEAGTRETLRVNLRRLGTDGARHEDIVLRNGDVVFVPETWF